MAAQIKLKTKNLKLTFKRKKVLLSTRQPPNLRKLLTTAKIERLPITKQIKQVGFFPYMNCICHKVLKNVGLFSLKPKNKLTTFLLVTVKIFYMYLFAIIVNFEDGSNAHENSNCKKC